MVLAALVGVALAAEDVQRVVLHASFGDLVPTRVGAVVQQAGSRLEVPMVDDGSDPFDARGDRVWTGSVAGAPAQYLTIAVLAEVDGQVKDVWTGTVRAGLERTVEVAVDVTTDHTGQLVGRRLATASPGRVAHATEAVPLAAAAFWATVVLVWGAVAVRLGRRP